MKNIIIEQEIFNNLPHEIQKSCRIVLWRWEARNGKLTKVPYYDIGKRASPNGNKTWLNYQDAILLYEKSPEYFSGIGIVLGDGMSGIDLDHVIDAEGNLDPKAAEIVGRLPGYVERSPSGTGIHILLKGSLPPPGERKGVKFGNIEFYDETSPRYLTLTGDVLENRYEYNAHDASEEIALVYWDVQKSYEAGKKRSQTTEGVSSKFDYSNDSELLNCIRQTKQGAKFTRLFDKGDISGYGSQSEAVAALLCILAYWTAKDESRMDKLFRESALYDVSKWNRPQSGSTWGALEIKGVCNVVKETFDPKLSKYHSSYPNLIFPDLSRSGNPQATLDNFGELLKNYGIKVIYDEIKKDIDILFNNDNLYSLDNYREASLGSLLSLLEKEGIPPRHVEQYLCATADMNRVNPVKDWILSKPWDKKDRIAELCNTIKAEPGFPDDLKVIFIRKWLLSAVAAAFHDAKKEKFSVRGVLVFLGRQGVGKTRWFRNIAPPQWVRDGVVLDPSDKDSVMGIIGYWLVELGELDSTIRRDIGRLKAFITKGRDELRLPYAKTYSQFPRRTVFCASVNDPNFLKDSTGNDRFWTIPVQMCEYDHKIDMQQAWAQVHEEYIGGAEWWLTPEESQRLAASNEAFEERDEIFDLLTTNIDWSKLKEHLDFNTCEMMTPTDVLIKRCGFKGIPSKAQTTSCGIHLRKLTGLKSKSTTVDGKPGRYYPIPPLSDSEQEEYCENESRRQAKIKMLANKCKKGDIFKGVATTEE